MTTTAFEHQGPRAFGPYQDADFLLAPPNPAERFSYTIDPRDRRRLDLQAALTTAGIPPCPEDRDALNQLSNLPASVNDALQRWLTHTL
ncbi:hypothetical protein [Streptomyces rishiriensis]|uniref:Uncharacterized protein n=1 Tax=Streptomyces rishiriensis TaxID=68264 RepID=A0ABU0NG04_STRRH|nr:hypothetical protein [Streptomyces rishiriensis]MDQ0578006.1 hypothetical protein [Streptomyces rishiriensis]